MLIYRIILAIWSYLLTYVAGGWCLLCQIFTRRKTLQGIPQQTGKVVIVTGGADGIGFHVSKGLVARNVHVIIGGKCVQTGEYAVAEIKREFPNAQVEFIQLDLESLKSVSDFEQAFRERNLPLHILINNAGVMFSPLEYTVDGFEKQLQVNYLSHYALTQLLSDKLAESGTPESWSRIVNVSSYMHYCGSPVIESLDERHDHWLEYSSHQAYSDSKLLIVATSNGLHRILREQNKYVSVNSLHPGVVQSSLWRHVRACHKMPLELVAKCTFLTTEQGAQNTLYAALSPEMEGRSGCYLDNMSSVKAAKLCYDEDFQNSVLTQTAQMIHDAINK